MKGNEHDRVAKTKDELSYYCQLLYKRGLARAAGGNVSLRLEGMEQFLITPGGVSLRDVVPSNLMIVDGQGNRLEGEEQSRPSKELAMHLAVYAARPGVNAVIHVHPPYATAFSVRGQAIPLDTVSSKAKLKKIPLVSFAPPGSLELAQAVAQALAQHDSEVKALLLAKHGILTFDRTLREAFDIAELVEESAQIMFIAANLH